MCQLNSMERNNKLCTPVRHWSKMSRSNSVVVSPAVWTLDWNRYLS
jgi:hypothetical protein